jgi:spore germination protein GerM
MKAVLAAAAALAVLVAAGCGGSHRSAGPTGTEPSTSTAAPTTPTQTGSTGTQPATQTLRVYLLRGDLIAPVAREVPQTQAVARAALAQLVHGPTDTEAADGLTTDVPRDAQVRALTIAAGVATVDWDDGFARGAEATISRRLAQVVFTLTQFATVRSVRFEQDGAPLPGLVDANGVPLSRPATRADYEPLAPPILIESPLPGESVTSPISVSGSAVAFEATFQVEVRDAAGAVVGRATATASAGGPARGTFTVSVPVRAPAGPVRLVAYEDNQGNGQRMHVVTVPLQLAP